MTYNRSIIILASVLLLGTSCSRKEEAPPAPAEIVYARRASPYHIVKRGDTVDSISKLYAMKDGELIRLNRLREPYNLIIGQRLLVSVKNQEGSSSTESSEITVKPLDDASSASPDSLEKLPNADGVTDTLADGSQTTGAQAVNPTNTTSTPATETVRGATHAVTYEWPVKGDVIQNFGQKLPDGSISEGINIKVPANIPVRSTAEGTVKVVKASGAHPTAYGNMVVLKHPDGKMSIYAHLSEASVKTGDVVQKAGVLGRTGKTGAVKETQLYFQIRDQNLKPLDPITVLP
jgi:murein DD-endopeptidase MepM/ murein hydrolase activator NlpD